MAPVIDEERIEAADTPAPPDDEEQAQATPQHYYRGLYNITYTIFLGGFLIITIV